MFTRDPVSLLVTEPSQVGEARRVGVSMAELLGFDETGRGEIAIVLTEIANNLLHHGSGGEIVLRSLPPLDCCGLEVLGLDRGSGIKDVADALRDGFTTRGTAGTGLGAVGRLSTLTDLYSTEGRGTAVLAQFRSADQPRTHNDVGWICLPKRGEEACGDACEVMEVGNGRTMVLIADGLGHGLRAAEASRRAVQLFLEKPDDSGPKLFERLHRGLFSTRGAAVTIADINRGTGELRITGVGNVAGWLVSPGERRGLVTQNGTVGAEMRRVQEFVYPWTNDSLLVMHSDGLGSQWQLDAYRGIMLRHASLIAGVLYRDFRRERDDVTVLALHGGGGS